MISERSLAFFVTDYRNIPELLRNMFIATQLFFFWIQNMIGSRVSNSYRPSMCPFRCKHLLLFLCKRISFWRPRIYLMLSCGDDEFATKFAKISCEEFQDYLCSQQQRFSITGSALIEWATLLKTNGIALEIVLLFKGNCFV